MTYFVYGKRTSPEHWDNGRRCIIPQDTCFRALNVRGERVMKLEQAIPFATREDAQAWLDEKLAKRGHIEGAVFEIRKVKD